MTSFLGFLVLISLFTAHDADSRWRAVTCVGIALVFAVLMMLSYWDWHP